MVGIVVTGPKNTPASIFIPAPISSPNDWATRDVSTHITTNIDIRCGSMGCDVK